MSVADINRQLCERSAACARQNGIVGRIVQLELTERNGHEMARQACRIVYRNDHINIAVFAKDEVADPSDPVVLVADHRPEFERVGTIAFGDLRRLQRRQPDLLCRRVIDRLLKRDDDQHGYQEQREVERLHQNSFRLQDWARPVAEALVVLPILVAGRRSCGGRLGDNFGYQLGVGVDEQDTVWEFDKEQFLRLGDLVTNVLRYGLRGHRIRNLVTDLRLRARWRRLRRRAGEAVADHLLLRRVQVRVSVVALSSVVRALS